MLIFDGKFIIFCKQRIVNLKEKVSKDTLKNLKIWNISITKNSSLDPIFEN